MTWKRDAIKKMLANGKTRIVKRFRHVEDWHGDYQVLYELRKKYFGFWYYLEEVDREWIPAAAAISLAFNGDTGGWKSKFYKDIW